MTDSYSIPSIQTISVTEIKHKDNIWHPHISMRSTLFTLPLLVRHFQPIINIFSLSCQIYHIVVYTSVQFCHILYCLSQPWIYDPGITRQFTSQLP